MLSVLRFKKSMFSGALDGGEKDVFLGGSRLERFMETVDSVTSSVPETPRESPELAESETAHADAPSAPAGRASQRRRKAERGRAVASTAPEIVADPFASLLQSGLALLEQFAASAASGHSSQASRGAARGPGIPIETMRDEATGRTFLKLPMPDPATLDRLLQTVSKLLEGARR
jgi:hypothetical protein